MLSIQISYFGEVMRKKIERKNNTAKEHQITPVEWSSQI